MKPHVVKFFQFLEDKEGKNAPIRFKLLNSDGFNFTTDELNVDAYLDLSYSNITSLPIGLNVGKYLNLIGCTSLTSLPDGLKVGGSLALNRCISLKSLPPSLDVVGNLSLANCTSLTSLPKNLRVNVNLNLENTPLAKMYSRDKIRDIIESKGGYVGGSIYT